MDLREFLESLMSPVEDIRRGAEKSLRQFEKRPGFVLNMVALAKDGSRPVHQRQLVLTIVKDILRNRWVTIDSGDYMSILRGLLQLSMDIDTSIRALSRACVCVMFSKTRETAWPVVFEYIQANFASSVSTNSEFLAIHSFDILREILEENGSVGLATDVDVILSSMITASNNSSNAVCCLSFKVFTQLVVALSLDEEFDIIETIAMSPWIELSEFLCKQDVSCVVSVISDLKLLLETPIISRLVPILTSVLSESIIWLERSASSNENTDFVIAIIDLLTGIAVNDISNKILTGKMNRIMLAIGQYLQITDSEENQWDSNPNEFISNEQEESAVTSVRLSFEGFLADCLDNPFIAVETVSATAMTGVELIRTGSNSKSWRLIEAGLFMVSFIELPNPELREIINGCCMFCADKSVHGLLRARSLLVLAKSADSIAENYPSESMSIISLSIDSMSDSPVVAYAATRAFAGLLKLTQHTSRDATQQLIMKPNGAFACLCNMATQGSDETLHYALDTLVSCTSVYPEIARLAGPPYYKFLLTVLMQHSDDPFIPEEILELVRQIYGAVSPAEFDCLAEISASQLMHWIRPDAECQLDTALEFVEFFVQTVQFVPASLMQCVTAVSSNELKEVGPETANRVDDILRICAERQGR